MGSIQKQFAWVFFLIPGVMILFTFILYIAAQLASGTVIFEEVHNQIIEAKLLYSPNCFAYRDPVTGRVYNSYIDVKKFDTNVFRECLPFKKVSQRGAMAILYVPGKIEIEVATENFKQKISATQVNSLRPVNVVFEDGEVLPGLITIVHWYSE